MANHQIDSLSIKITSDAQSANRSLNTLSKNLYTVAEQLGRLGAKSAGLNRFTQSVTQLSQAMVTMKNSGIGTADFTRLVKNLNAIANVDSAGIDMTAKSLDKMGQAMSNVSLLAQHSQSITEFTKSLSQLGRKGVSQAIENLPRLTDAFRDLLLTLNEVPEIRQDIRDMTQYLANFVQGAKGYVNQAKAMDSANAKIKIRFDYASQALEKFSAICKKVFKTIAVAPFKTFANSVKMLANGLSSAVTKVREWGNKAEKAEKTTSKFAQTVGTLYVKFWLLARVFGKVFSSIKSSFDYLETVNYFNSSFGAIADKATETMSDAGEKSAEEYYDSFTKTATNLTKKMTGFDVSGGNLTRTTGANLGLDPQTTMNYQATFAQIASSMGVASDKATILSNVLTEIGADLASVKNMDFADTFQDMSSALVGMSRAVDKYGINLRASAMQEKLASLGIEKKVKDLSQADKALLRTIMILDASKYAWADLADTLNSPANQIRMLTANLKNLATMFGSLFLPILKKVLPYLNAVVIALQRLIQTVAKVLGIDLSSFLPKGGGGSDALSDVLDESEELGDNLEDDADSAKKLKNNLLGIDELNIIGDNSDALDIGDLSADSLLDQAFLDAISDYQKAWDEAFKKLENKAQEIADKIVEWAKKVWKPIGEAWDAVGERVKEQFRNMAQELGKLFKDIARDWARVWESDAVEKTFEHLFKAVGNIAEFIGNLARQFREAWNEGEKGYKILQTLANIIEKIAKAIEKVTESWAKWAGELNFNPILQSILDFLRAIEEEADTILGIFIDFNELFLQEGFSYLVETFLPRLLDILTKLIKSINWERVRTALADIFKSLEQIGETIGNFLLERLDDLATVIASLVNKYLPRLAEGFKNLSKELRNAKDVNDVINALFNFADGRAVDVAEIANFILETFNKAIEKVDWKNLGNRIGQFLMKFVLTLDFAQLGRAVSNIAKAFFQTIQGALEKVDWFALGRKIGDFLKNIDWIGIFNSVWKIIKEVVYGIIKAWAGSFSSSPVATTILTAIAGLFVGGKLYNFISKLTGGKGLLGDILSSLLGSKKGLGKENSLFEKIFGSAKKASESKSLFASANGDVATSVAKSNGLLPMELDFFGKISSKAGAIAKTVGGLALVLGGCALAGVEFGKQWKDGVSVAQSALMALGIALAGVGAVLLGAPAMVVAIVGAIVFAVAEAVLLIHEHWDEIKAGFEKLLNNCKEKWNNFKDNIGQSWDNFKQNLEDRWRAIQEGFTNFITEWGNKITLWATSKWDEITNKVEEVRQAIYNKWQEIHANFDEHIAIWGEKIATWAGAQWDEITNKIEEVRQFIVDKWAEMQANFDEHINAWHERITKWAEEKWNEITEKVEFVRDFIQERWGEMQQHFDEHIARWREQIHEWATSKWEEITEKMDEIKQSIWERWEAMKADFDDFRERWKEKIEAWASEKWDAVINAMQELRGKIQQRWEEFKQDFDAFLKDWWKLVESWAQEKWQDVIDTFDHLRDGIKNKWEEIKNDAKSFWENFKTTLGSLAENCANAISGAFDKLKQSLSSTWNSIKDGASSAMSSISGSSSSSSSSKSSSTSTTKKTTTYSSGSSSSSSSKKTTTVASSTKKASSGTGGSSRLANQTYNQKLSEVSSSAKKTSGLLDKVVQGVKDFGNSVKNAFSSLTGKKYATGGFPEDGFFYANHNELVGKFSNGRTAVANNEQITAGIEQATYNAFMRASANGNGREEELLQELIVAVKQGSKIVIDGREVVTAYDNRKARNGYAF